MRALVFSNWRADETEKIKDKLARFGITQSRIVGPDTTLQSADEFDLVITCCAKIGESEWMAHKDLAKKSGKQWFRLPTTYATWVAQLQPFVEQYRAQHQEQQQHHPAVAAIAAAGGAPRNNVRVLRPESLRLLEKKSKLSLNDCRTPQELFSRMREIEESIKELDELRELAEMLMKEKQDLEQETMAILERADKEQAAERAQAKATIEQLTTNAQNLEKQVTHLKTIIEDLSGGLKKANQELDDRVREALTEASLKWQEERARMEQALVSLRSENEKLSQQTSAKTRSSVKAVDDLVQILKAMAILVRSGAMTREEAFDRLMNYGQ